MMPISRGLLAPLCLLSAAPLHAQDWVQTGRYSAVAAVPTAAQRAPLDAIVTVEFSERVTTVGQAIQALVDGTGYTLSDVLYWDVEVLALWERPLPDVHRTLGPLSVRTALETLVGPAFHLVVDPVHRLLGFALNPGVKPLGFGSAEPSQEIAQWKRSF